VVIPVYDENPTRRRPYVTWALIAANVVVFLLSPVARGPLVGEASTAQLCSQQAYFLRWGAIPRELTSNRQLPYTYGGAAGPQQCFQVAPDYRKQPLLSALTTVFVHGGWLHLLGNMLFLWVFGNNVEDRFGRIGFLLFYLAVGFLSTYAFALTSPSSEQPLVGASGAISGVLGAYLVLFPRARVLGLVSFLFFLPLRLPAWLVLGFYFVLQAVYAYGVGLTGGTEVAYLVHVVGFVLGVAVVVLLGRRLRPPPPAPRWATGYR
jgi:membrane associated rhomboid family serine protease